MSILWTRLGRFGQLILAHVLFMLVAFSGGGLVSNGRVRRAQVKTLDLSLFVLPGACALSAVIVLCLHGWGCAFVLLVCLATDHGGAVLRLLSVTGSAGASRTLRVCCGAWGHRTSVLD
jgi:hypothetical protein